MVETATHFAGGGVSRRRDCAFPKSAICENGFPTGMHKHTILLRRRRDLPGLRVAAGIPADLWEGMEGALRAKIRARFRGVAAHQNNRRMRGSARDRDTLLALLPAGGKGPRRGQRLPPA